MIMCGKETDGTMTEKAEIKYRHELKYQVTIPQIQMLKNRINRLIPLDCHVGNTGSYSIRSLYFDDMDNRCFHENEDGTEPREKFRIRIYNHSLDRITLECKRKERGKCHKTSCRLTLQQTKMLMEGKILPDIANQPPLLRKLTLQMQTRRLRPVVIVEYERIPYVYRNGNVRVTLDMNVCSSSHVEKFLDDQIPKRPIMPAGQHLMEVKFDEYLPDFIHHNLNLHSLTLTAYSKYALCRKYTR